jgi:hypothetical protein
MPDSSLPQPSGEVNPLRDAPGFIWYPPAPLHYTVRETKICTGCTGTFVRDLGSHVVYCRGCIARKAESNNEAASIRQTENRLRPPSSDGHRRQCQ